MKSYTIALIIAALHLKYWPYDHANCMLWYHNLTYFLWPNDTTFVKVTKSHLPPEIIAVCSTRRGKFPFLFNKMVSNG